MAPAAVRAAEKEVTRGEKNIPAEQSLEKENTWISCTHEDERRPPRDSEKASARKKEAFSVSRLRGHRG